MDFKRYHRINSKGKMRLSPALTEFLKADTVFGWLSSSDEDPFYIARAMGEAITAPVGENEDVTEIPIEGGRCSFLSNGKNDLGDARFS